MKVMYIVVSHNYGFFSCCSVILHFIAEYCNTYKQLPDKVDSSGSFGWYKLNESDDVTYDYFERPNDNVIELTNNISVPFTHFHQYIDYKTLNFDIIVPFIAKYFSPSMPIRQIISEIEYKYNLINQYDNICVLFHRGNDKSTETKLCSYDMIIEKARIVQSKNPETLFLIQSDETEFIHKMTEVFPTSFYFKDEIRHIKSQIDTVDRCMSEQNCEFSKKYLAITVIMSKCRYIICGSGNCSLWIMLYRQNANNIIQFREGEWHINI